MTGISQLWHGLLFGVCRLGIAFLVGSNIMGDTVGMLGHGKLCLVIRRRSRGP